MQVECTRKNGLESLLIDFSVYLIFKGSKQFCYGQDNSLNQFYIKVFMSNALCIVLWLLSNLL